MDPFGASVRPLFLFPDGYLLFERVDQPLARREGISPMGAGHDHRHASFTGRYDSQPMDNLARFQRPPLPGGRFELLQLLEGHLLIRVVPQLNGLPALGLLPSDTQE